MSIYHICTNCELNGVNNPVVPCPAQENPYDDFCEKHDKFMQQMRQKMNKDYYRAGIVDLVK